MGLEYGYLINNGGGDLDLYYWDKGSIIRRNIQGDIPGTYESIAQGAMPFLFVTFWQGERVLVYQRDSGEVIISAKGQERMLQGSNASGQVINPGVIFSREGMRFVYANGSLVTRSISREGNSQGLILDEPKGSIPYRLIPVVEGGSCLLYKRYSPDLQLGYREVTASAVGEFNRVYSTGFDIGDSSLCIDGIRDRIHIAFVSMNRFAVRVMYCQKQGSSVTKARNLWEGNRCSCVCIGADGADIFIWWESGGHIFESTSHNGGESFTQCVRKGNIKLKGKVQYICPGRPKGGITELMLMEGYRIYAPEPVREIIKADRVDAVTVTEEEHGVRDDNKTLVSLREELARKQEQLDKLSHVLKCRNEEFSKRELSLRKKNQILREELSKIYRERSGENEENSD